MSSFLLGAMFVAGMLVIGPVCAATSPDEMLPDPALEAHARALGKELRCLVCQNQSIDDSDAPLAEDLRRIVRERLVAGDSDAAIKRHLVERYGDFVLLEPPFKPATWLLWLGPLLVLAAGGMLVVAFLRRRPGAPAEPEELDPAERRRLEALLAGDPRDRPA
jgi:cytochrome c-type biogenesis protein CcmH